MWWIVLIVVAVFAALVWYGRKAGQSEYVSSGNHARDQKDYAAIQAENARRNEARLPSGAPSTPLIQLKNNGRASFDIVGEGSYQSHLRRLAATGSERHIAVITQEPTNRYDPDAIKVEINGSTVGYFSRENNGWFGDWIESRSFSGRSFSCPAEIIGGFMRDDGEVASLGVRLAINTNPPGVVGEPEPRQIDAIELFRKFLPDHRCGKHSERQKGDPAAVTFRGAADDGFLEIGPCSVCQQDGFRVSEKGKAYFR